MSSLQLLLLLLLLSSSDTFYANSHHSAPIHWNNYTFSLSWAVKAATSRDNDVIEAPKTGDTCTVIILHLEGSIINNSFHSYAHLQRPSVKVAGRVGDWARDEEHKFRPTNKYHREQWTGISLAINQPITVLQSPPLWFVPILPIAVVCACVVYFFLLSLSLRGGILSFTLSSCLASLNPVILLRLPELLSIDKSDSARETTSELIWTPVGITCLIRLLRPKNFLHKNSYKLD